MGFVTLKSRVTIILVTGERLMFFLSICVFSC